MKKFERFIIYPLLIVALFYSFAGEQVTTTAQDVIDKLIVREISVIDDEGIETINITSDVIGGKIVVNSTFSEDIRLNIESTGLMLLSELSQTSLGFDGMYISNENINTGFRNGSISVWETTPFGEESNLYAHIGLDDNENAGIVLNNNNGDQLIGIGADTNGHGLINIYDKYGEDWRSYSFR